MSKSNKKKVKGAFGNNNKFEPLKFDPNAKGTDWKKLFDENTICVSPKFFNTVHEQLKRNPNLKMFA